MTKAEEAALKAYPIISVDARGERCEGSTAPTGNDFLRGIFQQGYEQAEEDIISIIESRIGEILGDAQPAPVLRAELNELIKRIKQ